MPHEIDVPNAYFSPSTESAIQRKSTTACARAAKRAVGGIGALNLDASPPRRHTSPLVREAFARTSPHAGAGGSDPVKQAAEILSRPIVPDSSDTTKRAQGFQDFQQLYYATRQQLGGPKFQTGR